MGFLRVFCENTRQRIRNTTKTPKNTHFVTLKGLGLTPEELEALADSLLAPAAQARLDDLLARRKEGALSTNEDIELDRLLRKTDQLTILKTRARYTLNQTKAEAAGA